MNDEARMKLCPGCYEKLKDIPNIVKTGSGLACFGGVTCGECGLKTHRFTMVEMSNKNIEIHSPVVIE